MGKKIDDSVLGSRIGHSAQEECHKENDSPIVQGLVLSQIVYKPIEFFIPNPCNSIFDSLKTQDQLDALYKDIDSSRVIVNPLIAMPDGTLVEGHSRLLIAKRLQEEGRELGLLPVRIISTPLTNEEIKQRVYLGNLLRFEIDEDTRISLYAEIWPDYFYSAGKAGRKSDHGDTISASSLSEKLGKSIPQIKRDASIFRNASKKAGGTPTVDDIKESRKEMNEERKKKSSIEKKLPVCSFIDQLYAEESLNESIHIENFFEYAVTLKKSNIYNIAHIIEYLANRVKLAENRV